MKKSEKSPATRSKTARRWVIAAIVAGIALPAGGIGALVYYGSVVLPEQNFANDVAACKKYDQLKTAAMKLPTMKETLHELSQAGNNSFELATKKGQVRYVLRDLGTLAVKELDPAKAEDVQSVTTKMVSIAQICEPLLKLSN